LPLRNVPQEKTAESRPQNAPDSAEIKTEQAAESIEQNTMLESARKKSSTGIQPVLPPYSH
jgi:hypothetical protein